MAQKGQIIFVRSAWTCPASQEAIGILARDGFDIIHADSWAEAAETAESTTRASTLVVELDDRDGTSLEDLANIKLNTTDLPIFLITPRNDPEQGSLARQLGVKSCVQSSIEADVLASLLREPVGPAEALVSDRTSESIEAVTTAEDPQAAWAQTEAAMAPSPRNELHEPGKDDLSRCVAVILRRHQESAYAEALRALDERMVKLALELHDGNISAASRHLGITRVTLRRKLREFDALPASTSKANVLDDTAGQGDTYLVSAEIPPNVSASESEIPTVSVPHPRESRAPAPKSD